MLHTLLSEPKRLDYPQNPYADAFILDVDVDDRGDGVDQPVQCPKCKRVYPSREKVRQHIRKYCLKEKKFQCIFCQYRSKRKDHIVRHTERMHPAQLRERVQQGAINGSLDAFVQLDRCNMEGEGSSSQGSVAIDGCTEFLSVTLSEDVSSADSCEKNEHNGGDIDNTAIDSDEDHEVWL